MISYCFQAFKYNNVLRLYGSFENSDLLDP